MDGGLLEEGLVNQKIKPIAIEAAENASKMVVNYWTILKACEEAVRRKNGHGSDAKAEEYGYGYGR